MDTEYVCDPASKAASTESTSKVTAQDTTCPNNARMAPTSAVRVVSRRVVKPPPRPRHRIPLTSWDASFLSMNYIQKGLLFARPPLSAARLLDHLQAALAGALADYYPVAGRLATDRHRDDESGDGVVGCSVSIDCGGQGAEILHAVADGVTVADVAPHGADDDVPQVVHSFFPLDGAVSYDGHDLPLFALQVTELADGVFLGFACNHALADGTAFWNVLNAWAEIARARLAPAESRGGAPTSRPPPLLEKWSPDGGAAAAPAVLPCADPSVLVERPPKLPMRERMLRFSPESVSVLKERAREELLAAGDTSGAAAMTRFQALASLIWRCFARAWRLAPDQETVFRAAIDNRGRLRPPLPSEYFGNCLDSVSTEAVRASELLARGHGWAAAAVGRAVAAHTDAVIRERVAAWKAKPTVYTRRWFRPGGVFVGSSPRFDMYGCDFGWGKPLAVRSGKANKVDGKASLYPGRDGGIDVEVVMTPEHMAALQEDDELRAALTPKAAPGEE